MPTTNIAYIACGLATLIILAFYFKPFRLLLRAFFRTVLGFLSLFAINFAGSYVGISVGINIINGVFVGLLGLPGVAALIAVRGIFG